jgi:hypothetical protein
VTSSSIIRYDPARRRFWLLGQRCHHGAWGTLLALFALIGPARARHFIGTATALAAGGFLMAHDWHDRGHWFELGPQSDD